MFLFAWFVFRLRTVAVLVLRSIRRSRDGEVTSVTSGAVYSEGLQYDSAGRLTVIQETVNGTPAQYTYMYDAVGRLKSATKYGAQTTTWMYDGNGNRLTENSTQSTFVLTKGATTYTWDTLGGRKTKTEGGQTTQYTHDGLGALQSVTLPDSTVVTYEYDARQRRVAKRRNGAVEARWVYDGQYRVAAQLDASGTVTHRFVYGSQSHSPDYVVKGGVTYAYVKNHLGSIRFVVNAADGTVAQQLDYDAWGNVLSDSNPGLQPFVFAGGIYDRDTKLTHFGYRDYDSSAGVWTSNDPVRLMGGLAVYTYAENDPLRQKDVWGLRPGDRFSGRWAQNLAAVDALDSINPKSKRAREEYGGMVCRDPITNQYFATVAVSKGADAACNPHDSPCPAGTISVATYHTHGWEDPSYGFLGNNRFSPYDVTADDAEGLTGYLGTPSDGYWIHRVGAPPVQLVPKP
jgi:RHS repeat-associated protein